MAALRNMTKPQVSKNVAAIAAIAGTAATAVAGFATWAWRRFGPGTYARFDTMFGRTRVYEVADDDGSPVRLLEVGGIVQSGTYVDDRYTELVFEYLKCYDTLFDEIATARSALVLGCGGYDFPKHLIAHHPEVVVDAVEIDPSITAIARRYFFLDRLIEEYDAEERGRLHLICNDALAHLQQTEATYDVIVNDAFDAGTPPAHLATRAFAQAVFDRLNPGGVYMTNIVSPLVGPDTQFLDGQVDLLHDVFGKVRILPCAKDSFSEDDNIVLMCRRAVRGQSSDVFS